MPICLLVSLSASRAAQSESAMTDNDIQWYAMGRPPSDGSNQSPLYNRIHRWSNELLLLLLPNPWASASSLGVSSFGWQLQGQLMPLSDVSDPWFRAGTPPHPVLAMGQGDQQRLPQSLSSVSLLMRKGLPLSTDLSLGIGWLPMSQLGLISGFVRMSVLEGYSSLFPHLALGLGAHHLLGSEAIWIVAGEAQATLSYRFTPGDWLEIFPCLHYSHLFAAFEGQLIDLTPEHVTDLLGDQISYPQGSLFSPPSLSWQRNQLQRASLGLALSVAPFSLGYWLHINRHPFRQPLSLSHGAQLQWIL